MDVQHRQKSGQGRGRRYGLTAALGLGVLAFGLMLHAVPVAADTWNQPRGLCPTVNPYVVPAGTRFVKIVAIGGAGTEGSSYNATNTGGNRGLGAEVWAIVPVTPGQELGIMVGENAGSTFNGVFATPNGGASSYLNSGGGGSSAVSTAAGNPCLTTSTPRGELLVVAGGGGGGGGGNTFGSGGNGGNAGLSADLNGQAGSSAYTSSSANCDNGGGGGGGSATAAGGRGVGGCFAGRNGNDGSGFNGGAIQTSRSSPPILAAGGAGGGGYYGGGGGGGGAGSSHVSTTARATGIRGDTTAKPSITITPYQTPTTTATLAPANTNDWFTAAPTITLTASAGSGSVAKTYYALDNPACDRTTILTACTEYTAPFSVSSDGLHTLTYFTVDALGVDEAVRAKDFALTTTTTTVSGADIGSGTNPAAATSAGGRPITVTSTGSGVVGTAVYGANPGGGLTFNSGGAYIDVIAVGSLSTLTVTDCHLNDGTRVYWWNGTAWALISSQGWDPVTGCVRFTLTSSTSPSISQLTGTVIASGSPPATTAVAKTADGKAYTAGTWTNQSVTVTFTCSANATATAPVTLVEGSNQSAAGTCTDGIGQATPTTFTPINVDKTPPTCATTVSPTVLWAPDAKLVAITGTTTVGDNRSGVASVVGSAVTSNEAMAPSDVQGFVIKTTVGAPLTLSTVVPIAGQLRATRNPAGSGRTYSQTVTVTDHAGNTNTMPCTWTVTVPRDQAPGR